MKCFRMLTTLSGCLIVAGCARAASPGPTPPAPIVRQGATPSADSGPGRRPGQGAGAGGRAQEPSPDPYDRVITEAAKTQSGLWKTHQIGSRLLFEIPAGLLGKDILVVPRVAKAPPNSVYGGQQVSSTEVVRWERRANRLLLRAVSYDTYADPAQPIAAAVAASNYGPVLGAFNVETYGPDSAAVVDVTRLFTAPPPELSPGRRVYRGNPDAARSLIERVLAFPINVEVEALLTVNPPPNAGGGGGGGNPFGGGGTPTGTTSLVMHWSMVKLPDEPMMPRLHDSRVGYFSTNQVDYGLPYQGARTRSYITRYRLDKKDPAAAISEPVQPIVYYVDPATPTWLVPYVKRGIESWQPAFEAAGFRNAIVAREAPDDPNWSPEDARYSVIRWLPSTIENAQGPNVHDPRSGQILEADVYMYHNVMRLARSWYFTQVGHLDPRASMWPFPNDLMGRLIEYVVAHEVGHTLGFPHNQKASSTYPADSVRSKTWVKRMGHTPTLMDYSRFNYTAQPEDSIDLADLVPGIGPYDKFVTMWGYKPIPGAATPDAERPTLEQWARMQDSVPWYRFNVTGSQGSDPGDQTEAVGDADAVKATGWGIANIKRIVPMVMPAAAKAGNNYDDLGLIYDRLIRQWATELRHVVTVVGGAEAQEKYAGQDGVRFRPMPASRQREAMAFLIENAFATPTFFLDAEILRRIEVEGAIERINNAQNGILTQLFNDRRMERMIEFGAMAANPRDAYSLADMLSDVRAGIWGEVRRGAVAIDPYRRELQRAYLRLVATKVDPPPVELPAGLPAQFRARFGPARATSDIRSLFKSELRALDGQIRTAIPRARNRETRAHLEDARDQIDAILNPDD